MSTPSKTNKPKAWTPAVLVAAMSLVAALWVGNMGTLFGVYIPTEMLHGITSPFSAVLGIFAIMVFVRRSIMDTRILRRDLLVVLALGLFIVGFRFVAGPPDWSGNDGFTVTGGFMMLGSGLLLGGLHGHSKREK